jgi:hypothetical protein
VEITGAVYLFMSLVILAFFCEHEYYFFHTKGPLLIGADNDKCNWLDWEDFMAEFLSLIVC